MKRVYDGKSFHGLFVITSLGFSKPFQLTIRAMSLSSPPLVGELFEGTLSEILYVQEVPNLPDVPVVLDGPRFVGEAELQDLINEIPKPSVEFQPSPSYISSCSIEEIEK